MNLAEEKERLIALIQGDKKAFELFYGFYRPQLYGYVFKLVRSHEVSQEIFQDIFIRLWKQREQIDPEQSIRSYLYTIAQNLVYDYYKKVASDRNKLETFKLYYATASENNIEELLAFKEVREHLDTILAIIPEKCRQVYVLCKLEGRSYQEVANLLNISISTVNNHIVKASSIIKNNWKSDVLYLFLFFFIFQ
ncbi:RNA polymerase sigma-70 factor [Sphingobacterium sp.]|uniref:RNA polymerase sigma factor n=1 Tax=Sphingobacterium sp. TaxID=341027 RepID=UPI0028A5E8BF|nr:RNA polymerase sigma-70 factor [Sphingobacterium sp.]